MQFETLRDARKLEGRRAILNIDGWDVIVRIIEAREPYGVLRFTVRQEIEGATERTVDAHRLRALVEG